jgi:hypothetical protein
MAGQSVVFDFLTRGVDSTAGGFRKVADNTVLAARGAKVLANAIETLGQKENRTAAESKILASALRQTGDAEDRVAARAVLADAAIRRLDDAMQDTSKTAGKAGAGFSGLAGAGGIPGGGMAAVAAAGVVLSPVIATLAAGFSGLGLAALGVSKNAALMKTVLAPLKSDFASFSKSLQPEVLTAFSGGIRIAGHLLHDMQPVAAATGKALGVMLGQVDRELQSGTWKQFFGFMASTAGPDMQLLTSNFVDLAHVLPPLLEDLQPLATGFLQASDNALKLAGSIASFGKSTDKTSNSVGTNVGVLGFLSKAVANVTNFMHPGGVATGALNSALAGIPGNAGKAGDGLHASAVKAQSYAQWVQASAKATTDLANAQDAAVSKQLAYGNDILTSANDAQAFHDKLKASKDMIGLHTQAQRDSFGAANQYITDLGNTAAQAYKSGKGVDASIRAISDGLPILDQAKTKNRAYWQEVKTLKGWLDKLRAEKSIRELVIVTGQGTWTMHNPKGQSLPGGFPGGTGAARGLKVTGGVPGKDSVPIMAMPGEAVVPTHLVPPLAPFLRANKVPGFAAGGIVPHFAGSVAGEGRWAAADNRAAVKGLETGLASIMITAIRHAQKSQLSLGFPGGGGGMGGSGVQRWAPLVSQVLSMLGQPGGDIGVALRQMQTESGGNPTVVNRTDSNWLAGHPSVGLMQVIAGTFDSYAGRYRNVGPFEYGVSVNPLANIYAGLNYAVHRYGPAWTRVLGQGHGYDSGTQYLPPGPSLAWNNTGRPERVGGEELAPLLRQVIAELRKLPGAQAAQLGRVLSGRPAAPRPSVFAAR